MKTETNWWRLSGLEDLEPKELGPWGSHSEAVEWGCFGGGDGGIWKQVKPRCMALQ